MMLSCLEIFLFFVMFMTFLVQQPLSLGFFILLYCFFCSVLVFVFFSSWFSLSLFLIYIGGMLVLFGYVLVLTPNFVFSVSFFPFFFLFFFFFFFFPSGDFSFNFYSFSFSFFSYSNLLVYVFLAFILFVGLISVSKICFFQVGALRPFFLFYV